MKDNLHKLVKKDCFLHKKKLQIQYSLVRSFKDKDEKYKLEFKNMTDKMNEMKSEIVALRRKIEERDLELSTKNSTLQSYEEQLRSIPHLQIDLFNATQNLRKQTLTINQMKLQEDEHKQNFQGLIQTVHKLNSYIESLKLDIAEREAKLIEKEGLQLAYTEKLKTIAALEAYIRGMQNDKEVSTAADTMEVDEYHRYVEFEDYLWRV
jgi:chromosome segregation ATPase